MGFISYKFFPKIKTTQENIKKESDNYVKVATENITGIREIKALGIKKNIERNIFSNLDKLFIFLPLNSICPDSGFSSPIRLFASVDFPHPDSPAIAKTSPFLILKLTPFTARTISPADFPAGV